MAFFSAGLATASLGFLAWFAAENVHARRKFDGAEGERLTSDVLRTLRIRGWKAVDDIEFEHLNVDHVVVGPGGAFAVETKWTNEPWIVEDGSFISSYALRAVKQSRDGADRIGHLLRGNFKITCQVEPLLVIWGPGRPTAEACLMVDGVAVVPGELLRRTVASRGGVLTSQEVKAVVTAIKAFVCRKDDFDRRRARLVARPAR